MGKDFFKNIDFSLESHNDFSYVDFFLQITHKATHVP